MVKFALFSRRTGNVVAMVEGYRAAQKRAEIILKKYPSHGYISIVNMTKVNLDKSAYIKGSEFNTYQEKKKARGVARARKGKIGWR